MESFWKIKNKSLTIPSYKGTNTTDILILGGGMTGIMSAYLLSQREDLNIVMATASKVMEEVSAKTNAKITPIHNLLYQDINKIHGIDAAKKYFESQNYAMEHILEIIKKEKIDCDLVKVNNYSFAQTDSGVTKLEKEYDVLTKITDGIKYVDSIPTNTKIKKAFHYKENYMFDPLKYLNGILAILLKRKNVTILEEYNAIDYEKKENNNYTVLFDNKKSITSKYVIVATHYPIFNIGLYFGKLYQEKSYLIAFETEKKIDGIYINTDPVVRSLRYIPYRNKQSAIMLGNSHISGKNIDEKQQMEELKQSVYAFDPKAKIITTWTNQDVMSIDYLPFIGPYSRFTPNMFVATSYHTWGMTNSHLAALILTDQILDKDNPYSDLYSPLRFSHINSLKESLLMMGRATNGLILSRVFSPTKPLSQLGENEGAIITYHGKKYAAYHDKDKYILLKPSCTHVHCFLRWNSDEKTWDCKCHGSRFSIFGDVLTGPATKSLKKIIIKKK